MSSVPPESFEAALDRLRSLLGERLVAERRLAPDPARPGELLPPPPPPLAAALAAQGIERLWSHQVEAITAARAGRNVLVTTATASGKSLVFQLPVLEEALAGGPGRAIFLFPLKALGQDQRGKLLTLAQAAGLGADEFACEIYDGDTPAAKRAAIRRRPPQVLVTNPDMLHLGILAHPGNWRELLANLKWIVLDELHVYRGLFGAHFHHVLQRLLRLARAHGARPAIIASSATAQNAREFAELLAAEPFLEVTGSGAPREARRIFLVRPEASPYTLTLELLDRARRVRPEDDRLHQGAAHHRAPLRLAAAQGPGALASRRLLPLRFPSRRAAGDRGEAALRRAGRRDLDLGARARHRHRRARRLPAGRISRQHDGDLAALGPGGAARPRVADRARRPAGCPRPVPAGASRRASRPALRAAPLRSRERAGSAHSPRMRRRRGAALASGGCPVSRAARGGGRRSAARRDARRNATGRRARGAAAAAAARRESPRDRRHLRPGGSDARRHDRHARRGAGLQRRASGRGLPALRPPVRGGRARPRSPARDRAAGRGRFLHFAAVAQGDRDSRCAGGARDRRSPGGAGAPADHRAGHRLRTQADPGSGGHRPAVARPAARP